MSKFDPSERILAESRNPEVSRMNRIEHTRPERERREKPKDGGGNGKDKGGPY